LYLSVEFLGINFKIQWQRFYN